MRFSVVHGRPKILGAHLMGSRRCFMKHFISIFSSFLVLFPFYLFAQEKEVTLDRVVVTATRDEEEIRKIPANVTVITREEIEQSHARTTVDLLKNEADVVVRDVYGTGKTGGLSARMPTSRRKN
jgi:outer membrane cobalamin receptor